MDADHQPVGTHHPRPAPVPVPRDVLDGIEAVRRSGLTNMLDRPRVAEIAAEMGHDVAAAWVREHRDLYAQAIFHGFTEDDDQRGEPVARRADT